MCAYSVVLSEYCVFEMYMYCVFEMYMYCPLLCTVLDVTTCFDPFCTYMALWKLFQGYIHVSPGTTRFGVYVLGVFHCQFVHDYTCDSMLTINRCDAYHCIKVKQKVARHYTMTMFVDSTNGTRDTSNNSKPFDL